MSAATLQALVYTPPRPVYLADRPSLRQFLRAARTNALLIWPEAAYERDIIVNRPLGRTQAAHQRAGSDPPGAGRKPRQLSPVYGLPAHPPAHCRRRDASERRRQLAASAAHHRAFDGASHDPDAGPSHRGGRGGDGCFAWPEEQCSSDLLQEMQFTALDIAAVPCSRSRCGPSGLGCAAC